MQTCPPGTAAGFASVSGSSAHELVERRDEVPTKPAIWQGPGCQGAPLVPHNTSTSASEVFAGIDWGGSFHQICLINTQGDVIVQQRVQHDIAGLTELDRLLLVHRHAAGRLRVAIERADGLLVEHLHTCLLYTSPSPRDS